MTDYLVHKVADDRKFTYLCTEFITYEKTIFDFYDTNHVAVLNFIFVLLHLRLRCLIIIIICYYIPFHQLLLLNLALLLLVLPSCK